MHHSIVLSFTAFHRYQVFCFFFFTPTEGLWQPCMEQAYPVTFFLTTLAHFVSLCHSLVILAIFQTCSLLFHLLRWSAISDLWCYRRDSFGEPHTVENLTEKWCACSDWSANWSFPPVLSLSSGLPIPWDTTILKLGRLITQQWYLSVTRFSL